MKCQGCSDGDCHLCGMQTWCTCDCDGSEVADHGTYDLSEPGYFRCVCGHIVHGNIGGSGACRTHGCPCESFREAK